MNFSKEESKATKDKVVLSPECTDGISICFSLLLSIEKC